LLTGSSQFARKVRSNSRVDFVDSIDGDKRADSARRIDCASGICGGLMNAAEIP
jgi:hypothetical protein